MKNFRFFPIVVLSLVLLSSVSINLFAQDVPEGFILVEGGKFVMGSNEEEREQPIHEVYVDAFLIGKYEVTQAEYIKVMKDNPSMYKGDDRPVNNVSWYQATKYCNNLSKMEGLTPCYSGVGKEINCDFSADGYRLPSEAEWEFAAKGGTKGKGFIYSGSDNPDEVGVYNKKLHTGPQVPGTKKPNELGIFDMTGNVRELCWDWFAPYKGVTQNNPTGPKTGDFRIERGGSWKHDEYFCRNTNRWFHDPIFNYGSVGFRVVRTVVKQDEDSE